MNAGAESNSDESKAKGDLPTQDAPVRRRTGDLELLAPTKTRATAPADEPQPTPAPQRLPTQFGRYRLIRELGRGGMGAVVLAEDTQLGRQVALKIPFLNKTSDERTLKRFAREAKAAAALSHPNLCAVYDFGTFEKHHYLSMAYIEGRPLQSYINSGTEIPQRTAASIIRKAAAALEHAHQRGVIHRDLKPSNIMIEPNLGPVITDFGLARCLDDEGEPQLTQDGVAIGTPSYMSPEQLDAETALIGPKSDIFSLGLIFYEMLTGQRRFQGKVASIIGQILTKDPVSLKEVRPDVDPLLDQICQKMMARDPAERYASMGEVANVMRAYLKGRLTLAGGQPVAKEAPSDPELFFAGLAASESGSSLPASAKETGRYGETEPEMVPPIVISETDSVSSHMLQSAKRTRLSRKTIAITGIGTAAVLIAGLLYWNSGPAEDLQANVAETRVETPTVPKQRTIQNSVAPAKENPVPGPNRGTVEETKPALPDKPENGATEPGEDDAESIPTPGPVPIPPLPMPEPMPAPDHVAEETPTVWLNDAKGKLDFQATVRKTINGSTTDKKFTIPRPAVAELLKLEQREQQQDKALEKVRVVISLNGNIFEFQTAKEARVAAAAFEAAVPHNISIEEILERLKRLNPKFIKPPEEDPTLDEIARFEKEFDAIYNKSIVPYMSRMNKGRGPLSQRDIDLAQVRFEKECRGIKGLPEGYPIPPIRYRFLPVGAANPNLYQIFVGDSLRLKDQTVPGVLVKHIAEALNAGTLIDPASVDAP